MIITSLSRGRGTALSRQRDFIRPVAAPFRVAGGLPCAAVAGVASGDAAVREVRASSLVVPETRPIIVSPVASAERTILQRFLADLAVAPDLTGELVALYVEQHPPLALRFVAAALRLDTTAAVAIKVAAERRAAHGLGTLALVLLGALALAAPPAMDADPPPVIVDIDLELDRDLALPG